jgi:hypothetical protein
MPRDIRARCLDLCPRLTPRVGAAALENLPGGPDITRVQKVALSEVTYVPWGEWVQPTAFRKEVQGILKFTAPIFWNVKIA